MQRIESSSLEIVEYSMNDVINDNQTWWGPTSPRLHRLKIAIGVKLFIIHKIKII